MYNLLKNKTGVRGIEFKIKETKQLEFIKKFAIFIFFVVLSEMRGLKVALD